VLFEVQGCSIREIAGAMNCSEGAVKFNIHQARKKLKSSLREYVRRGPRSDPPRAPSRGPVRKALWVPQALEVRSKKRNPDHAMRKMPEIL